MHVRGARTHHRQSASPLQGQQRCSTPTTSSAPFSRPVRTKQDIMVLLGRMKRQTPGLADDTTVSTNSTAGVRTGHSTLVDVHSNAAQWSQRVDETELMELLRYGEEEGEDGSCPRSAPSSVLLRQSEGYASLPSWMQQRLVARQQQQEQRVSATATATHCRAATPKLRGDGELPAFRSESAPPTASADDTAREIVGRGQMQRVSSPMPSRSWEATPTPQGYRTVLLELPAHDVNPSPPTVSLPTASTHAPQRGPSPTSTAIQYHAGIWSSQLGSSPPTLDPVESGSSAHAAASRGAPSSDGAAHTASRNVNLVAHSKVFPFESVTASQAQRFSSSEVRSDNVSPVDGRSSGKVAVSRPGTARIQELVDRVRRTSSPVMESSIAAEMNSSATVPSSSPRLESGVSARRSPTLIHISIPNVSDHVKGRSIANAIAAPSAVLRRESTLFALEDTHRGAPPPLANVGSSPEPPLSRSVGSPALQPGSGSDAVLPISIHPSTSPLPARIHSSAGSRRTPSVLSIEKTKDEGAGPSAAVPRRSAVSGSGILQLDTSALQRIREANEDAAPVAQRPQVDAVAVLREQMHQQPHKGSRGPSAQSSSKAKDPLHANNNTTLKVVGDVRSLEHRSKAAGEHGKYRPDSAALPDSNRKSATVPTDTLTGALVDDAASAKPLLPFTLPTAAAAMHPLGEVHDQSTADTGEAISARRHSATLRTPRSGRLPSLGGAPRSPRGSATEEVVEKILSARRAAETRRSQEELSHSPAGLPDIPIYRHTHIEKLPSTELSGESLRRRVMREWLIVNSPAGLDALEALRDAMLRDITRWGISVPECVVAAQEAKARLAHQAAAMPLASLVGPEAFHAMMQRPPEQSQQHRDELSHQTAPALSCTTSSAQSGGVECSSDTDKKLPLVLSAAGKSSCRPFVAATSAAGHELSDAAAESIATLQAPAAGEEGANSAQPSGIQAAVGDTSSSRIESSSCTSATLHRVPTSVPHLNLNAASSNDRDETEPEGTPSDRSSPSPLTSGARTPELLDSTVTAVHLSNVSTGEHHQQQHITFEDAVAVSTTTHERRESTQQTEARRTSVLLQPAPLSVDFRGIMLTAPSGVFHTHDDEEEEIGDASNNRIGAGSDQPCCSAAQSADAATPRTHPPRSATQSDEVPAISLQSPSPPSTKAGARGMVDSDPSGASRNVVVTPREEEEEATSTPAAPTRTQGATVDAQRCDANVVMPSPQDVVLPPAKFDGASSAVASSQRRRATVTSALKSSQPVSGGAKSPRPGGGTAAVAKSPRVKSTQPSRSPSAAPLAAAAATKQRRSTLTPVEEARTKSCTPATPSSSRPQSAAASSECTPVAMPIFAPLQISVETEPLHAGTAFFLSHAGDGPVVEEQQHPFQREDLAFEDAAASTSHMETGGKPRSAQQAGRRRTLASSAIGRSPRLSARQQDDHAASSVRSPRPVSPQPAAAATRRSQAPSERDVAAKRGTPRVVELSVKMRDSPSDAPLAGSFSSSPLTATVEATSGAAKRSSTPSNAEGTPTHTALLKPSGRPKQSAGAAAKSPRRSGKRAPSAFRSKSSGGDDVDDEERLDDGNALVIEHLSDSEEDNDDDFGPIHTTVDPTAALKALRISAARARSTPSSTPRDGNSMRGGRSQEDEEKDVEQRRKQRRALYRRLAAVLQQDLRTAGVVSLQQLRKGFLVAAALNRSQQHATGAEFGQPALDDAVVATPQEIEPVVDAADVVDESDGPLVFDDASSCRSMSTTASKQPPASGGLNATMSSSVSRASTAAATSGSVSAPEYVSKLPPKNRIAIVISITHYADARIGKNIQPDIEANTLASLLTSIGFRVTRMSSTADAEDMRPTTKDVILKCIDQATRGLCRVGADFVSLVYVCGGGYCGQLTGASGGATVNLRNAGSIAAELGSNPSFVVVPSSVSLTQLHRDSVLTLQDLQTIPSNTDGTHNWVIMDTFPITFAPPAPSNVNGFALIGGRKTIGGELFCLYEPKHIFPCSLYLQRAFSGWATRDSRMSVNGVNAYVHGHLSRRGLFATTTASPYFVGDLDLAVVHEMRFRRQEIRDIRHTLNGKYATIALTVVPLRNQDPTSAEFVRQIRDAFVELLSTDTDNPLVRCLHRTYERNMFVTMRGILPAKFFQPEGVDASAALFKHSQAALRELRTALGDPLVEYRPTCFGTLLLGEIIISSAFTRDQFLLSFENSFRIRHVQKLKKEWLVKVQELREKRRLLHEKQILQARQIQEEQEQEQKRRAAEQEAAEAAARLEANTPLPASDEPEPAEQQQPSANSAPLTVTPVSTRLAPPSVGGLASNPVTPRRLKPGSSAGGDTRSPSPAAALKSPRRQSVATGARSGVAPSTSSTDPNNAPRVITSSFNVAAAIENASMQQSKPDVSRAAGYFCSPIDKRFTIDGMTVHELGVVCCITFLTTEYLAMKLDRGIRNGSVLTNGQEYLIRNICVSQMDQDHVQLFMIIGELQALWRGRQTRRRMSIILPFVRSELAARQKIIKEERDFILKMNAALQWSAQRILHEAERTSRGDVLDLEHQALTYLYMDRVHLYQRVAYQWFVAVAKRLETLESMFREEILWRKNLLWPGIQHLIYFRKVIRILRDEDRGRNKITEEAENKIRNVASQFWRVERKKW